MAPLLLYPQLLCLLYDVKTPKKLTPQTGWGENAKHTLPLREDNIVSYDTYHTPLEIAPLT